MAEQFGKTWWGQRWLQALNNIDFSNRLPRGASYARKGSVVKLQCKGNCIQAKVSGSRVTPYKVEIVLPVFPELKLANFIAAIADRPLIISKLLNRELDPSLLEIASQNGLRVFPNQWSDLQMKCSCPDWAVPCKHLAAVVYKMSAEIDNNPFLVFELHLADLISELKKKGMFINAQSVEIPALVDFYFNKEGATTKGKAKFEEHRAYHKLSFAALSPIHEPLISLLAENPVFYNSSSNFKEKYAAMVSRMVRNGQKLLHGKLSFPVTAGWSLEDGQKVTAHSDCRMVTDENFHSEADIDGDRWPILELMAELDRIPGNRTLDFQPSTASLHTLSHLALHLVANGAIVPQITVLSNKQYIVRWLPALISKEIRELTNQLSDVLPPDIFHYQSTRSVKKINKQLVSNLLSVFITELVCALSEDKTQDLFVDLFFKKKPYSFQAPGEGALAGGVQAWLNKYYLTQGQIRPQLIVSEMDADVFKVEINVLGLTKDPDTATPLNEVLLSPQFGQQRLEVLQAMATLSSFVPGLEAYINSKGLSQMLMGNKEFTAFLFQMVPVIRLLDMDILLPKSLQEILRPKPSVRVKARPNSSFLRMEELLYFDWQVAIGDTVMGVDEFKALLQKTDSLLKYKSNYIYISEAELGKLYKHFAADKQVSNFELLRTALSGEYEGMKIAMDSDVLELIKELTEVKEVPLPLGIKAQLRPYQLRGYSWMYRNSKIGFGSVIADDMGLGKTLQVIATLLKYKEEGLLNKKKALVIAPTGLLPNWQAEIEKFAPELSVCFYHGANRIIEKDRDLLLTSYGIARSEAAQLKKLHWHSVVIDEAQNIKNQDTAQAKAIKGFKADNFIAMSGTPVENRLSELWSIMDYSNRGLLGSIKDFKESFSDPIETLNSKESADKLKKVTAPFIMRRMKSDKSIINDLPDKIEMDSFSFLAKEQASLYEKTLEEALKTIEAVDTADSKGLFVRNGLVLQMILALKQICNHPTQFLKNNNKDASLSGKTELLFDKLDSIVECGEKVLIFTQFREMGDLLQHFISERYGDSPMFYHGGCSLEQRKEMVHRFQTNPADKIFILSLKAAGTGLNLTAAKHVIHYDLWWNPAVEAQATDRAYRIGQKSNVMVHRFITEMTVSTGENWIGNLSNKELKDLFQMKG